MKRNRRLGMSPLVSHNKIRKPLLLEFHRRPIDVNKQNRPLLSCRM
jgi:hypothetical protein